MSKQTSIFQFKGFKRTIHQGQYISNEPPKQMNLLEYPHCEEIFKNNQGLSSHVKCKHANEYVKEMKTNTSGKIPFKKSEKQDHFEVKEVLEKLVDDVVKAETEVVEGVHENKMKGNKV